MGWKYLQSSPTVAKTSAEALFSCDMVIGTLLKQLLCKYGAHCVFKKYFLVVHECACEVLSTTYDRTFCF